MILNLLSNAVRFSPADTTVQVTTSRRGDAVVMAALATVRKVRPDVSLVLTGRRGDRLRSVAERCGTSALPVVADKAPEMPLSAWELASRLSYFLWGSMPDDALFAAARDGKKTVGKRGGESGSYERSEEHTSELQSH